MITWNGGAERLYGYSAEEITGQPMALLLPADRTDEETLILARIRRGEHVEHFETVRRGKTGVMVDVSLSISPIRDASGEIVAISHVARNITDQKQMNAQLRRLAAIVESSEDAIVSKMLDSTILTWNAAAEHLYGYTAAEAISLP